MADTKPGIWDRIFETTDQYKARTRAESAESKDKSQSSDTKLREDLEKSRQERMRLLQKGATK